MLSLNRRLADIAAGRLSAAESIADTARDIAARDPTLHAFVHQPAAPMVGSGPLAGIAVGVKDIIDTANMPTEMGCPALYGGWQPRADAAIVARLKVLGATVAGKTATTAFASTMEPAATLNPHGADRTPGGSSSGSAAAVAAGLVPLALGTQTAGSVIRPASFCGVAAIKPSFRLLPTVGVKTSAWTLDTLGLFAASVPDLTTALALISGRPMADQAPGRSWRFGLFRQEHLPRPAPEAEAALEAAAAALSRAGHVVVPLATPAGFVEVDAAQKTIQNFEMATALAWEGAHSDALPPQLARDIATASQILPSAYDAARGVARRARFAWRDLLGEAEVSVILTYAAPGEAPARTHTGDPAYNRLFTLLGTPCVNVPGPRAPSGLPVGVQVVAPFARDAEALAAATALEQSLAAALL